MKKLFVLLVLMSIIFGLNTIVAQEIPSGVFYVNGEKITIRGGIPYMNGKRESLEKILGFGDALPCAINAYCPGTFMGAIEGVFWFNGATAFFVNNQMEDGRRLFITASHMVSGMSKGDIATVGMKFRYESEGCDNPPSEPGISGNFKFKLLDITDSYRDIAICELIDENLPNIEVKLLGWDLRRNSIGSEIAVIGHSQGDIKKIALPNLVLNTEGYFRVETWDNEGTLYYGSSGSPLIDESERVYGVVSSGRVGPCTPLPQATVYCKGLKPAWDILQPFLDPQNTGIQYLGSLETALPVELTSFSANIEGKKVILNWETATEVNNYGFEVERLTTKNNWKMIGFVEGHGNSNSPKHYSFEDENLDQSRRYSYRLKQIDNDGSYDYSEVVEVDFKVNSFILEQNYPNPFNPSTKIRFTLAKKGFVTLIVYNVLGKEVKVLINENKSAGSYFVVLDASNLPSGVYFYKLQTGDFVQMKKMVLVK